MKIKDEWKNDGLVDSSKYKELYKSINYSNKFKW